jgi:hypothetical protein
MKKSLLIIAAIALVFAFTSCNKENSYTGKYTGTYTFFKQNGSVSNPDSTKSGKTVPILQTPNTILLYDVLPLYQVSDGMYQTSEVQGDMLSSLLQMAGIGQNAAEAISNVKVTADLVQKNTLMFKVTYEVELLNLATMEVRILQFDGVKQ